MSTPVSAAPVTRKRSSSQLTAALGAAVAVVAIVFAFNSSYYTHWYALFRVIHVSVAVFWVGGGLLLTVLALLAERRSDPNEIATIARQAAFVGEKLFAPAGLVVLLTGIAMMLNTDWGWGKFWIDAGLAGYAVTFATGVGVLAPLAKRINALVATKGATATETQEAIQRILLVARVDIAVLLLVVADMVTKPFS
jgi:uncharacterized membrane protein